jgi:hypothetical protein
MDVRLPGTVTKFIIYCSLFILSLSNAGQAGTIAETSLLLIVSSSAPLAQN